MITISKRNQGGKEMIRLIHQESGCSCSFINEQGAQHTLTFYLPGASLGNRILLAYIRAYYSGLWVGAVDSLLLAELHKKGLDDLKLYGEEAAEKGGEKWN